MSEAARVLESSQYLTFTLDEEVFAVEIAKVREVLEFATVTKMPCTPKFMRGVINLRGSVVPVLDLKAKFGMERTERTVDTCVIITEVAVDGETVILGALADSVQEVIDLEPGEIELPPRMGTRLDTRFLQGMGKRNGEFLLLLDIDQVFSAEELDRVLEVGPGAPKKQAL